MKQKRRILSLLLALIMIVGLVPAAAFAADGGTPAKDAELTDALPGTKSGTGTSLDDIYTTTGDYIASQAQSSQNGFEYGNEWMVLGLARAGRTVPRVDEYVESVKDHIRNKINQNEQLNPRESTNNSRVILALTSLGVDPTRIVGHDLVKGLSDIKYDGKQGINGLTWALIALDSHNYEPSEGATATRDALISELLSKEMDGGGWVYSSYAPYGPDVDITAMTIQSLARYYSSNADVKAAVDRGLEWLSGVQNETGAFGSVDGASAESCAQVIVALTALGIDPAGDERFIKNGCSVLDGLCSFYVSGGGFRHLPTGAVDGIATQQGYYALASYYRLIEEKTALYNMTDVEFPPDDFVTLKAANLTLEGKITVNFKVAASEDGYVARFYYEKNDYALVAEVPMTGANWHSDALGEYYLVSYDQIPAKEMTEKLRIKVFDAEGNQVKLKTSTAEYDEYDYSVATWCNNRIAKSSDPKEVELAKALLNYGHYSQLDLKYKDGRDGRPDKLANPEGYLADEMDAVAANADYSSVINNGKELGAKAFALVLESNTSIKLKLKRQVAVTINGASATLHPETENDGTQIWAVFKDDIPAKKLHEKQTFVLTEGSNSATMLYGALSWANSKLNGSNVDDKNLAKAMYLYNYAARKYFNYDANGLQ